MIPVQLRTLRKKLLIEQANGYLVGAEKISAANSIRMWCRLKSRDTFVVIPKPQMEAALQLANREEFDINAMDAFYDVLANYKMMSLWSPSSSEHPPHRVVGEIGMPHSNHDHESSRQCLCRGNLRTIWSSPYLI